MDKQEINKMKNAKQNKVGDIGEDNTIKICCIKIF